MDPAQPDFGWPHEVTDRIVERLGELWSQVLGSLDQALSKRPLLFSAIRATILAALTYLLVLWCCFCYIDFPVRPYGFGEAAKWLILATGPLWAGLGLYIGAVQLVLLLWLLLLIVLSLTLSLVYLCWVVWDAHRKQSLWLRHYGPALLIGLTIVIVLATFVDGSRRFWDGPFEFFRWGRFVLVSASAWSALVCHFMRHRVSHNTPRRMVKWTLGSAIVIAALAYWQMRDDQPAYVLRKAVIDHPNDRSAWLGLAWHYKNLGDQLAGESGDEDNAPPDPTQSYMEALECFSRAVNLGASGFDVFLAQAQAADAVGEEGEARAFAERALRSALSTDSVEDEQLRWLKDRVARNVAGPPAQDGQNEERVRDRRRAALPGVLRWPFNLIESMD